MRARAIFTDEAIAAFEEADQPIRALDPLTGIRLIYQFDAARGGVLTCYGGPLGRRAFSRSVPVSRLQETAQRMCDGLVQQRFSTSRPPCR